MGAYDGSHLGVELGCKFRMTMGLVMGICLERTTVLGKVCVWVRRCEATSGFL